MRRHRTRQVRNIGNSDEANNADETKFETETNRRGASRGRSHSPPARGQPAPRAAERHPRSFTAILGLMARFKALRESQGLTLAELAERMEIDAPATSGSGAVRTNEPAY